MCRATQDQHKSLCQHKPWCEMVMHDSWWDKKIRSNPHNHLCNPHATNQIIGDSMQPVGDNQGFELEHFVVDCMTNH